MVPYTTPKHIFRLGFSTSLLSEVRIYYKQNDNIVLEKTEGDCEFIGNNIVLTLSQNETGMFMDDVIIKIQLQIKTTDGVVAKSRPKMVSPNEALEREVL